MARIIPATKASRKSISSTAPPRSVRSSSANVRTPVGGSAEKGGSASRGGVKAGGGGSSGKDLVRWTQKTSGASYAGSVGTTPAVSPSKRTYLQRALVAYGAIYKSGKNHHGIHIATLKKEIGELEADQDVAIMKKPQRVTLIIRHLTDWGFFEGVEDRQGRYRVSALGKKKLAEERKRVSGDSETLMDVKDERIWLAVAKAAPPHVGLADFDPGLTRATSLPTSTTGRASGGGAAPLLSRISKKRAASEVVEGRSKRFKRRGDEDETNEDEEEKGDLGEYKSTISTLESHVARLKAENERLRLKRGVSSDLSSPPRDPDDVMVMDEVVPDEHLVNGQEEGGSGLRSPSFQDVLPFLEDGDDRESDIDGREDEKGDEKEDEAFFARDDDGDNGGGMNYEPEQDYVLNTPPALDLDDGPEAPSSSGAFASGSSPSAQAAAHREVSHPRPLSSHPSATRFSRPATPSATPQGGKDASVADESGEDDLEGELLEVFGEVAPQSILEIGKTWKETISSLSKVKSDLLTKVRDVETTHQEEVANLRAERESLKGALDDAQTLVQTVEARDSALQQSLDAKGAEIASMDAQVASLSMNSNGLAATLADRQAELDALIVLVPEKDAAIAALLVEKELATERAREEDDRHAFEVQKLETKIANTITEYQSTAHTQTTALQSITAELETAQESNDTLNNLLTVEKGLLDMANQSNETLKRDLESSYQTLASLREKVAQTEKSSRDSETSPITLKIKLHSTTDALHERTEAFEDLQAGHNLLESEKAGIAMELKERTEEREKALEETARCMDERDELRSSVNDAEYGRMDAQRKLAAAERSSKELEEKLKGVEDRTSGLENDLKVKHELLASRAEEVDVLEQELVVERAEILTLKEKKNDLLKKVTSLETVAEEVASLRTQVAGIEEALAASEKEKEGQTESIAALKQQLDDAQTQKTDVMQQLEEQKTAFLKSVEKHVSQSVTSNRELQSSVHSSVVTTPSKRTISSSHSTPRAHRQASDGV